VLELSSTVPGAANIRAYAQIIRDGWTKRQIQAVGHRIAACDGDAAEALDAAISDLMRLSHTSQRHEYSLRDGMSMAYAAMKQAKELGGAIPGISTGIAKLDAILGGWHDSDLVVVGARAAMGKTALLLNFAHVSGVPCGIISAEQPVMQVAGRVMSLDSGISATAMRSGHVDDEDLAKLHASVKRLIERKTWVYDRSAPTIGEVCRVIRKWHHQHGIRIAFVDYIQRIESDRGDKRYERVGDVVRQLKNLARDLQIPVIALAQVSRAVEQRQDKRPHMGDLSDSSEIEKEADQILMLYRDEVYDPESKDRGTAELLIEKNRHGPTGFVRCAWLAETMKFGNLGHA
jgi:replicative DNA helicase